MNGKHSSVLLLDTNIVISLRDPEHAYLQSLLFGHRLAITRVVQIEVLCWDDLTPEDIAGFDSLLSTMTMLELDERVVRKTIDIRKTRRLKLPDATIAATALVHRIPLWTHNSKDFKRIEGLEIHDPIIRA